MSTPAEQQQALQQAAQFVAEFQNALAPARLQNTHENGVVLEAERQRRKLPMTVESLVKITNDILFEGKLTWLVEPAKLKARQQNTAIQNKNDAAKSQDAFAAKVKAGEVADAHAKAEAEAEKDTLSLIATFFPISKRGQLDHAKQSEVQKLLRDYVAKQKAIGAGMKSVQTMVSDEIRRQYELQERSVERL
jgi:hypothetical protein